MPEIPLGNVVGPQGPQGPKGDKGDTGTFDPADLQRITNLENGKVDKVTGKGLSTNDYTDADKTAVNTIGNKVDKVTGKGLSTNDYTDADKTAVNTIGNKVDKVTGKGLSTNDYTDADKNKLAGIPSDANHTTIDSTLSNAGQAADAKATGDAFAALRDYIASMDIDRNASGNPATFSDAKAANVKALSVTLTPTQSGSGDPSPSNVRPISGVSSVGVSRTGKNLLEINANGYTTYGVTFTVDAQSGTITANGTAQTTIYYLVNTFSYQDDASYILSGCPAGGAHNSYFAYNGNTADGFIDYGGGSPTKTGAALSKSAGQYYYIVIVGGTTCSNLVFRPMVRLADTDASFAPYQGQTVTVSLVDSNNAALTVCDGTLDVTTGTLTVNRAMMTLTSANLSQSVGSGRFLFRCNPNPLNQDLAGSDIMCSHYEANPSRVSWGNLPNNRFEIADYHIGICDQRYTDAASYGAYLDAQLSAGTPVTVTYAISPVTYSLTPQQLATLSGYNAVSSNAGNVAVTYKADTSLVWGGG